MEIEKQRQIIDQIDDQIASLYKERIQAVKKIGEEKKKTGTAVHDPNREEKIILRVTKTANAEEQLYLKRVFSSVFSASRALETFSNLQNSETVQKINYALDNKKEYPIRAKVACQGVAGAYSGIAAKKLFEIADITYFKTFDAVFSAVEKGFCKYGVLPIENNVAGSVNEVYDLMREHNFYIVKSVRIPVVHNLVANKGVKKEDIKEIISHEQAIAQSRKYLEMFKDVKVTAVANTAVAAETVHNSGRLDIGALSSRECASEYDLTIVEPSVQDSDGNYTRFILIAKDIEVFSSTSKISIMTTLSNKPGSLYQLLGKFYNAGINLTKLESRPINGTNFEFTFYFDFECDLSSNVVKSLIAELENSGEKFTFLGAYSETI